MDQRQERSFGEALAPRRLLGLTLLLVILVAGVLWQRETGLARSGSPTHPRAEGPVEVLGQGVVDGEHWQLAAYRSDQGICVDVHMGSGSGGGCGFGPMRGDLSISSIGWNADLPNYAQLEGRLSERVARLAGRSGDGAKHEVSLYESERLGVTLFVVFAPVDADYELVAYDESGEVLERKLVTRSQLDR